MPGQIAGIVEAAAGIRAFSDENKIENRERHHDVLRVMLPKKRAKADFIKPFQQPSDYR